MQESVDSWEGRRARGARLRSRDSRGVFIALVAAVLALAGCSASGGSRSASLSASSDPNPSVSDVTGSRSSVSPNPPTSTSPTDLAKSEVLTFLPTYYSTLDRLSASQTSSLNELDQVTTDNEATVEKTTLAEERVAGETQQGTTELQVSRVTSVDLAPTGGTRPSVHVTACINVKNVREVDKSGKSITLPTRPNFFVETLTVVNIAYPASDGWRVSAAPNMGAQSCDGV